MKHALIALIAGLLFGLGLIIGGMTNPAKILNFLDIMGHWDPSLGLVMAGALLVTLPGYYLTKSRQHCLLGSQIHHPTKSGVDRRLVLGSALFGIGWGLGGLCPGPAVVAITTLQPLALLFGGSMLAGMLLFQFSSKSN